MNGLAPTLTKREGRIPPAPPPQDPHPVGLIDVQYKEVCLHQSPCMQCLLVFHRVNRANTQVSINIYHKHTRIIHNFFFIFGKHKLIKIDSEYKKALAG